MRRLERAGLDFSQVLAALTTAPASRWLAEPARGTVAVGQPADLVILRSDPRGKLQNFSQVRYTIRAGKIIHASMESH